MSWPKFITLADGIREEQDEQNTREMVLVAYGTYLQGHGQRGESYKAFLERLGLTDKEPPLTEEQKAEERRKSMEVAEKINAAMKAGRIA